VNADRNSTTLNPYRYVRIITVVYMLIKHGFLQLEWSQQQYVARSLLILLPELIFSTSNLHWPANRNRVFLRYWYGKQHGSRRALCMDRISGFVWKPAIFEVCQSRVSRLTHLSRTITYSGLGSSLLQRAMVVTTGPVLWPTSKSKTPWSLVGRLMLFPLLSAP